MRKLNLIIADNLKKIREDRKLSLDKVAELTNISKSMLGQIERGESNPSITTVWQIVNGLKIQFSTLIDLPQEDTMLICEDDTQPILEDNGRYRAYPIFPYEENRRFEVFAVEIDKGGYLSSTPHVEGTQEFITVFVGELTLRLKHEEYVLKQGDSIRFRADRAHSYYNSGEDLAKLNVTLFYPVPYVL